MHRAAAMPGLALTRRRHLWSYAPMIRAVLILLCFLAVTLAPAAAQPPAAPPGISADQARTALDVLNDPAKRAAFTATLNAIATAQPGHQAAAETKPAEAAPTETKVE